MMIPSEVLLLFRIVWAILGFFVFVFVFVFPYEVEDCPVKVYKNFDGDCIESVGNPKSCCLYIGCKVNVFNKIKFKNKG